MSDRKRPESILCPACGSPMSLARLLKGYSKTGEGADRLTCPLHGPLGKFHHIATDRRDDTEALP